MVLLLLLMLMLLRLLLALLASCTCPSKPHPKAPTAWPLYCMHQLGTGEAGCAGVSLGDDMHHSEQSSGGPHMW